MKKFLSLLLVTVVTIFLISGCKGFLHSSIDEIPTGAIVGKVVFDNLSDSSGITVTLDKTDGLVPVEPQNEGGENGDARTIVGSNFTIEDGSFKFEALEDGLYTVYASSSDSLDKAVVKNIVVSDGQTVTLEDLHLNPVGSLSGTITFSDDADYSGFLVSIAGTSYMATTGTSGEFTISGIPSGNKYEIIIMYGNYTYYWKSDVTVTGLQLNSLGSISFEKATITAGGESGSKGEQGEDGDKGDKGDQVDKGDQGDKGDPGADGTKAPKTYFIFFNANESTSQMSPQIVEGKQTVILDECTLVRPGSKYFYSWNTKADGSGTTYFDKQEITVTETITLYAQWRYQCTVYFYNNDKLLTSQNIYTQVPTALNHYDFEPVDGKYFSTWNTKSDGSGTTYSDEEIVTINRDGNYAIYFYAQFKDMYKLTFYANDGTNEAEEQEIIGERPTLLNEPDFIKNKNFSCWTTNSDGTGDVYFNAQSITITGNTSLYAQWNYQITSTQLSNYLSKLSSNTKTNPYKIQLSNVDKTNLSSISAAIKNSSKYVDLDLSSCKFTEIPGNAFSSNSYITSVEIPSTVTNIGNSAFSSCSNLTAITIPTSVTSIGNYAFSSCSNLTALTIPASVTSIENSAFSSCSGLTTITVNKNNPKYDSRNDCNAIIETDTNTLISGCENTVIPNTVTSIGNNAFYYCSNLTSITIPSSVTSIGDYAFYYCYNLKEITIPDSVVSIGSSAFYYCYNLKEIIIPNSVVSIGSYAFERCSSLTTIEIPASVTSIGYFAFLYCSKLTSLTFEDTSTWYKTSSSTDLSRVKEYGTEVDLSDPAQNVTWFTDTSGYYNYFWYKLDE